MNEELPTNREQLDLAITRHAIKRASTTDLLNEIYKRTDDVTVIDCPIYCLAKIQKGEGKYSEVSFGKSKIIVVGE